MTAETEWIAVDWGTSHLRAWVMGDGDRVLAHRHSDRGMKMLAPEDFEPALLALIGDDLPEGRSTEVLICGMAGARQGWAEAPYLPVPWSPPATGGGAPRVVSPQTGDARLAVQILHGLCQASPADVMRGEETQIGGVLALEPGFEGVVCLPGTHSKWAEILTGEVVSFRSFLTGEIFALLADRSVLRHAVGPGWDDAAFEEGLRQALSAPKDLPAALFSIRAESLLKGLAPSAARSRLSGMLIGWELAGARPWWLGREVLLVGGPETCTPYARALEAQGVPVRRLEAGKATLAGLVAARRALQAPSGRATA